MLTAGRDAAAVVSKPFDRSSPGSWAAAHKVLPKSEPLDGVEGDDGRPVSVVSVPAVFVLAQEVGVDVPQHGLVGRLEHHRWATAVLDSLEPPAEAETPPVPRLEPREPKLRSRRDQVVALGPREREKLLGHHRTHLVSATVVFQMTTAAVPEIARRGVGATGLELGSVHVPILGHTVAWGGDGKSVTRVTHLG